MSEHGARRLLFEVLVHAVLDAAGRRRPDPHAKRWLDRPGTADDPFSFAWVCAHLELSPRRIAADLPGIVARLRRLRKDPRKNRGVTSSAT